MPANFPLRLGVSAVQLGAFVVFRAETILTGTFSCCREKRREDSKTGAPRGAEAGWEFYPFKQLAETPNRTILREFWSQ
jgi:uncharacterized protein YcgI (DUF1989 family)